jgi:FkbM family methyltransferase
MITFNIENDNFRVNIDHSIINLIPVAEFPLKFRVEDWLTSDVYYETALSPGWWAAYNNTTYKNFCVYTNSGKLLKKLVFDPYNNTAETDQVFNIWVSSHPRSRGLILGAGTGRWGEWLLPVYNNECSVVLVEGDPNNIVILKDTYKNRSNVSIETCVVAENEGLVKFWIAPHNMVSSLDKNIVKKFFPDAEPDFIETEAKTINTIIKEHFDDNLDWIRIDLEGLDHKILMSLDLSLVPNLKMVLFENMNINQQEIYEIKSKLELAGFGKFLDFGIDTICVKF